MNIVKLDTKMKLMQFNNTSCDFNTAFLCSIPQYIINYKNKHSNHSTNIINEQNKEFININNKEPNILLKCYLTDHYTMHYDFIDVDGHELNALNFNSLFIKSIENYLWGLSTYKEVALYNEFITQQQDTVVLIKNDLFIK